MYCVCQIVEFSRLIGIADFHAETISMRIDYVAWRIYKREMKSFLEASGEEHTARICRVQSTVSRRMHIRDLREGSRQEVSVYIAML